MLLGQTNRLYSLESKTTSRTAWLIVYKHLPKSWSIISRPRKKLIRKGPKTPSFWNSEGPERGSCGSLMGIKLNLISQRGKVDFDYVEMHSRVIEEVKRVGIEQLPLGEGETLLQFENVSAKDLLKAIIFILSKKQEVFVKVVAEIERYFFVVFVQKLVKTGQQVLGKRPVLPEDFDHVFTLVYSNSLLVFLLEQGLELVHAQLVFEVVFIELVVDVNVLHLVQSLEPALHQFEQDGSVFEVVVMYSDQMDVLSLFVEDLLVDLDFDFKFGL